MESSKGNLACIAYSFLKNNYNNDWIAKTIENEIKKGDYEYDEKNIGNQVIDSIRFLLKLNDSIDEKDINYNSCVTCLNNNYDETKYKLFITFNRVLKKYRVLRRVNKFFPNLIFINNKFPIKNIENKYFNDKNNSEFSLIFVPYSKCFALKNIGDYEFFQAENIYDKYAQSFVDSYINAIKMNVIGIFSCELVGSKTIKNKIVEQINYNNDFKFLVLPSYHKLENNKYLNSSTVVFKNELGIEKTSINKNQPYRSDNMIEKLSENPPSYLLIHINGIGIIMVFICVDFLTEDSKEIIEDVNPNIIIIISYTEKYSNFETRAKYFSDQGILVILGNCCQKISNLNNVPLLVYYYDGEKKESDLHVACEHYDECKTMENCYYEICITKKRDAYILSDVIQHVKSEVKV